MALESWKPTASWTALRKRSELFAIVRNFFSEQGFLEVETPLLSHDTVVDRHLDPIQVDASQLQLPPTCERSDPLFLQTSPEFGMKRLVAAGSGPIFQICKAFRCGESGEWHNPEFTMLEWYDTRMDYSGGRKQLGELAKTVFCVGKCIETTYRDSFLRHAGIDPFHSSIAQLVNRLPVESGPGKSATAQDRDLLLDLILSEIIQPQLGTEFPEIVHDWPASQAALARNRHENGVQLAERFELYFRGVELANGYCELTDAAELRNRIETNNLHRRLDGKTELPATSRLLQAMDDGMPDCCGCALGLDRLLVLLTDSASISEVVSFPIQRA